MDEANLEPEQKELLKNFFTSHGPESQGDPGLINNYFDGLGGKGISKKAFKERSQSVIDPSILIDNRCNITSDSFRTILIGKINNWFLQFLSHTVLQILSWSRLELVRMGKFSKSWIKGKLYL